MFSRRDGGVFAPGGLLVEPAPEAISADTPPSPTEHDRELSQRLRERTDAPEVTDSRPAYWCKYCPDPGVPHMTSSEHWPCPVCQADGDYTLPPDRRGEHR